MYIFTLRWAKRLLAQAEVISDEEIMLEYKIENQRLRQALKWASEDAYGWWNGTNPHQKEIQEIFDELIEPPPDSAR